MKNTISRNPHGNRRASCTFQRPPQLEALPAENTKEMGVQAVGPGWHIRLYVNDFEVEGGLGSKGAPADCQPPK